MAQDAELKLKVSLDLAFFRQQLAGLGQAAAGYNMPVQVKFDRRSVQNELNALSANIRRRNYTLEVRTNLKAEIDNAAKLAKALQDLERASRGMSGGLPIGTSQLKRTAGQQGLSADQVKKLFGAAVQGGLLDPQIIAKTRADMVTALGSIGKDSIQGLLNGLESGNGQLKAAAQTLGKDLISTVKNVLGIASPSREFKQIGEDAGKGFEIGLLKAMDVAEQSASRKMRRMLDRLARMALMMSGMSAGDITKQAGQLLGTSKASSPSWQSTIPPSRNISIGPSSTGRMLPAGATPGMLPGTAFQSQKYLPTALGEETKRVLREAANAFLDAIRAEVRKVSVRDIGAAVPRQPLLGPGRIAGMLPGRASQSSVLELNNILAGAIREYFKAVAGEVSKGAGRSIGQPSLLPPARQIAGLLPAAGGTTPRGQMRFNSVSTGAFLGRPSFMRAPSIPAPISGGGGAAPPNGPFGRGGGSMGGMGGFGRAMGNVRIPGSNTIRDLGNEFAFATRQVLLFGQAYKMLAFIQDFPGQVGQAVSQLQSFRNTLKTVSTSAEEAAASNQLILNTASKFNVPLQSMRDGFTKLYASMQPAGFSGDQVRGLFTGISKAAATFGMSADKVDRVNYAFAQMASKGQVMSEELKGQLGDVLPGAMALFAQAAGFKGEKAIQDFSAALEEGRYKGEAMVVLLNNVSLLMNQKFGPGAEGASRTFQGAINNMQNSLKLFYESFEPIAVGFLNSVVTPLSSGIKTLTDGFNAFFNGTAAKTAGGFAIAQELEKLKPTFDGLRNNAIQLGQVFGNFGKILLDVSKVLLQIAGNPIVGYLAKLYAIALPINMALSVMRGLWISNAVQLLIFNARLASGTSLLTAFRGMMAATGATASTTAAAIRGAGLTLRTFFATTGVGLVVAGISLLIERFMTMNQRLEETKQKALGAAQAIRAMSQTEARSAGQSYEKHAKSLEQLNKSIEAGALSKGAFRQAYALGNDVKIDITREQAEALKAAGYMPTENQGRYSADPMQITPAYQRLQQLQTEARYRERQVQFDEKQALQPVQLGTIPPGTGEEKKKGQTKSLEELIGGDIKRKLDEAKAALEYDVSIRMGGAAGDQDAERMIKYYEKYRNTALEIQAINETIAEIQKLAPELTKLGIDPQEKLLDLRSKETELLYKLATVTQEQTNEAKKAADERAKQLKDYQSAINNIRIENGLVSAEETVQIRLAEQYQKIIEQFPFLREEEKEQVKALLVDNQKQLRTVREEIELLRAVSDLEQRRIELRREGYSNQRIQEILDLEKIRDNIKKVRELIDSFVTDTTGDYKNFLGEIISGKDAGDALREFQKSLKDRVLKIFLDFSLAPVEKFFKETLGQFAIDKLFPKTDAEKAPEEATKETALTLNTTALNNLTAAIKGSAIPSGAPQSIGGGVMSIPVVPFGAGEPLATASESLSGALSNVETSLASTASTLNAVAEEAGPAGATGKKWQESLGKTVQGIGIAAGSIMGIAAGISQMKQGGASNVLGGIGSIAMSIGGMLGGLSGLGGLFGGGGGATMGGANYFNPKTGLGMAGPNFGLARGGIMHGGFTPFRAFANGGIVTGPTMGLVGEGRYSEAVVPLPDGKSIPVQLGGQSSRDLLSGGSAKTAAAPMLSLSFQSTTINGVEYVDRAQLEQAMSETRRLAARDGASRGSQLALDKLRNSPNTRRQVGMR